jgi:sulfur-carrier protein
MSVDIELSSILSIYTDNNLNIKAEGKTVRECLDDLVRQYPKLKRMLLDKDGNLMHAYDFYINGESVYPKGMKQPLKDGDKLNIVFLIHGG